MARSACARICTLCLLIAGAAGAQEPLPHRTEEVLVDSGEVWNRGGQRAATFSETLRVEGATWLRLFFNETVLGQAPGRTDGSVLRITSMLDGAVQTHTARSLEQWQRSSAFFNGDAVRLELIADPDAAVSRVRITEVMVGELQPPGPRSICGAVDDRVLSSDARTARIVPVGCTGWLIDDAEGCFLTAGHCAGTGLSVIEFNVPLSNANGSTNHPPPEHQYAVDPGSLQSTNGGTGNDWAYFGGFPNSQTEQTPFEAQGQTFVLGPPPATPAGETIRITGYGTTTGTQGTPLTWSQVQTTHDGPLASIAGTTVRYATDTTGGDSGSAVENLDNGTAIGIHTHAGCNAGGGSNQGTSLAHAGLQSALGNPIGVCVDGAPPLRVLLASAIADPVPPAGTSFQVDIVDRAGAPAAINSATLVYDDGGGDQSVPLSPVEGSLYEATLPAMTCEAEVTFRVDVESAGGTTVHHPFSAPNSADRRYRRWVAAGFDAAFRDTFEADMGWTVDDDPALTAGSWERAIPGGYGLRQDPPWDADSSGQCFLTDTRGGNTDVDGGATRLTSPTLDATAGADPHITYWRWWDDGGASDDVFLVEVSDDDGASWVTLESIGPGVTGAWATQSFRVADFVGLTNQFRIRFTAADLGTGNVIEAAVDGVALFNTPIGLSCSGEIFSDGFESGDTSAWTP